MLCWAIVHPASQALHSVCVPSDNGKEFQCARCSPPSVELVRTIQVGGEVNL